MNTIRINGFRIGGLYRWALGDPQEIFLVLQIPDYIEIIKPNYVGVLSNKFSRREMMIFYSDKFIEMSG